MGACLLKTKAIKTPSKRPRSGCVINNGAPYYLSVQQAGD